MRLYKFVECENDENGKTCRTGGITRTSLKALRHLPKVGRVKYVKGYIYKGRYNTHHVGVLVVGTAGSIRFGGFCWGYSGEGPRGLNDLFARLGIPVNSFTLAESPDFSARSRGEWWRVTFTDKGYNITVNRPYGYEVRAVA